MTEVTQHSINTLKGRAYLLFLDARSAFDRVIPELLIRNLYLAGMDGNSIKYINNRLTIRVTFINWDRNIMGPIALLMSSDWSRVVKTLASSINFIAMTILG